MDIAKYRAQIESILDAQRVQDADADMYAVHYTGGTTPNIVRTWRVCHINQLLRGSPSGFFILCDSKNRILWHFPCTGNNRFWPLLCVSFFSILCLNRHVLNFSVVIILGIGELRVMPWQELIFLQWRSGVYGGFIYLVAGNTGLRLIVIAGTSQALVAVMVTGAFYCWCI